MKKYTTKKLHENFVLIFEFMRGKNKLSNLIKNKKSYIGSYHTDWNVLMEVIRKIGDKTGFELVSGSSYSYWNRYGDSPLSEFGGYERIANIYEAVTEFVKAYNEGKINND